MIWFWLFFFSLKFPMRFSFWCEKSCQISSKIIYSQQSTANKLIVLFLPAQQLMTVFWWWDLYFIWCVDAMCLGWLNGFDRPVVEELFAPGCDSDLVLAAQWEDDFILGDFGAFFAQVPHFAAMSEIKKITTYYQLEHHWHALNHIK